ncbi:MAG: hypothetical protein ALAOOOJD_04344 [bacterium]|nr:hypothetical protein [bacterium]
MRNLQRKNLIRFGRRAFSVLGLLLYLACASKPDAPLHNPQRFAEVYAQILLASQMNGNPPLPPQDESTVKLARADSVLHALGVERRQFEAAIEHFRQHPELWQKVYTHIVKIIETQNSLSDTTKISTP